MKPVKIIASSVLSTAVLLSGLTVATAQSTSQTTPAQVEQGEKPAKMNRADFRKGHGRHGGRGMLNQIIQKVDADGDGSVKQAELDTFRAALVQGADVSGEGDISLEEFQTIYLELTRERMVDAFQTLDADGDGLVTQAERDSRFGSAIEQMDRNQDGMLDHQDRRNREGKGRDKHRG